MNLETQHIMALFCEYPLGVAIKFQKQFKKWKQLNEASAKAIVDDSNKKIRNGIVTFIFNETEEGQRAVLKMDIDRKLDKKSESLVCQVITSYFISNKVELSLVDISFLADEIETSFPHEKSSSYFDKATKRGPLYDKYHNLLRSVRNAYSSTSGCKKIKLKKDDKVTRKVQSYSEDEIQSNDFVKTSSNNIDWDIYMNHWIRSSKIRIDYLRRNRDISVTSIYQALKRPDGFILINYDFDHLYPQRHFQHKWNLLQAELIEILKRDIVHDGVKYIMEKLESVTSNQKVAGILLGLSCHLHGLKHSYGGESKKTVYKPTICDTFSSILLIVSQQSNVEIEFKNYTKQLLEKKMNQQALIIGFGSSVEDLSDKFCVVVEDMKYLFDGQNSLLRAVELVLKIYHVFDLEYPILSKSAYSFLCTKFLQIDDKNSSSSKVTRLLNSFVN
ncbi:hypothetical protein ACKWTF_013246 [Chironomus riparius]